MKKSISLLMVLALMLAMFAACANTDTEDTQGETTEETTAETTEETTEAPVSIDGADKLLSSVWADFAEDDKFYVAGGDYDNIIENDAGIVTNSDYMTVSLHLPEQMHEQVDQVASLVHGMNANGMTVAAYHLASGTDVAEFAKGIRDSIQNTQWMCGFPELLYIASIGEYVVVGFGWTDNINAIATHTAAIYPTLEVLYNEPIEA